MKDYPFVQANCSSRTRTCDTSVNSRSLLPTELWSINYCIYIHINDSYWILDSTLLIDLRLTDSCPELWFSHQEDKSELRGATSNFLSWITPKPEKGWLPSTFTYRSEYVFMILIHGPCGFQVRRYYLIVLGYSHHQLMLYSDFSVSRQMRIIDFLQLAASMSLDLVVDQRWLYKNFDHRWIASHHEICTFNSSSISTSAYTWGTSSALSSSTYESLHM